jgi:hypothetical protein
MSIPVCVDDIVADLIDGESGYEWWKPDAADVDLYLFQLQSDSYVIQRDAIMEALRDQLEDKHGIAFVVAAASENPAPHQYMDALATMIGIVRATAERLLMADVEELYENLEGRQHDRDDWDDMADQDVDQNGMVTDARMP